MIQTAESIVVSGSSTKFTNPMAAQKNYVFVADTDCWLLIGVTGASATIRGAGCYLFVSGQEPLRLKHPSYGSWWLGGENYYIHVIQDTAGGSATLATLG
jgi:hypothetical protein